MAKKITIKVEKAQGDNFYSCYMMEDAPEYGLAGYGKSAKEAMDDLRVAEQETRELLAEAGKVMPELEYRFRFDIGSFFNYYDYLSMAGVARRVGVNASLMRRYAVGLSRPKENRRRKIEECLHEMGKELQTATML